MIIPVYGKSVTTGLNHLENIRQRIIEPGSGLFEIPGEPIDDVVPAKLLTQIQGWL